jgi:drug/metabolite transporter (DMT)-like permease
MSVESVISVLAGWVILGDTLTAREILGCILVFTAVILAQLPAPRIKKADPAR